MRPALLVALLLGWGAPLVGQSALERTPNIEGVWGSRLGTLHFHFLHRFEVTDPPVSKVLNSPTFLVAAGLPGSLMLGARYASNSVLVPARPNEWEVFGRWAALRQGGGTPIDVAVQAGWNRTAGSADGELLVARDLGRLRVLGGGRAFSAFGGEEGELALAGGARLRLTRHVALAADWARLLGETAPEAAWSAGLQLEIPYTPHSLSLHASNANTTTLQGSTVGLGSRRWGFEFTVPLTLSRYFGGREPAARAEVPAAAVGVGETIVEMDNRLRFLPDTVRVRVGETVRWRNTSDIVHTVTADPERAARAENVRLPAGAAPFDSGDMPPGAEFAHRFTVAGEYHYVCLPHELAAMVGVVIVESGS